MRSSNVIKPSPQSTNFANPDRCSPHVTFLKILQIQVVRNSKARGLVFAGISLRLSRGCLFSCGAECSGKALCTAAKEDFSTGKQR